MKKTVLLVEDNPDNRLLFRTILSEVYETREYESGPAALEGLRESLPDLVLLDISLPGMDGMEALSLIRSDGRTKSLPVIALTAHAMAGDRERFLGAGFDGYVAKPIVDETELLQEIQRLLGRRP